jgi:hypothetical protein
LEVAQWSAEKYKYSSAAFYMGQNNLFDFLTDYREVI